MDSDSEDFVAIGTSFEREEASRSYRQKKPSASSLATTKALPAHLQVPTDSEGRRRFHGAFEGGFSAGYFNTVGSKEGWAPSSFRSSRGDRAPANDERSRAEAYMDDDEREALQASRLEARDAFDTFGEGAMRKAQRQFAGVAGPSRAEGGGGIIPGPVPGELVVAVADPAAQRLLRRMGWRPGKGVGGRGFDSGRAEAGDDGGTRDDRDDRDDRDGLPYDALRPAPVVPKLDRHGFGYDPFEGAEEFRALAKRRRDERATHPRGLRAGTAPARGEAFGVGAFEDSDEDAAAFFANDARDDVGHFYELADSASDSDGDAGGAGAGGSAAPRARLGGGFSGRSPPGGSNEAFAERRETARSGARAPIVRGFVASKHTLAPTKWYPPPVVPRGFDGRHAFPDENAAPAPPPRERETDRSGEARVVPPPPPPPPPSDAALKTFIDTTARFVAKNGAWFERMVREKRRADPRFAFLFATSSSGTARERELSRYYAWRLRTSRSELEGGGGAAAAAWAWRPGDIAARRRPLDADDRARALGEQPLARAAPSGAARRGEAARIASALSGAFVSAAVEGGGDGGDGGATGGGSSGPLPAGLTDAASLRARAAAEREKAEARAEAERAAAAAREASAPMISARTTRDWAPAALLCKRFGVPDPFELGDGRARPVEAAETMPRPSGTAGGEGATFGLGATPDAPDATDAASRRAAGSAAGSAREPAPVLGGVPTTEKENEAAESTEVRPPPFPFPDVSDEAEAFLRGVFFKKQIFEDSDDEAEAERRADRAEAEEAETRRGRKAAEASAAPPPPPPPRPDAAETEPPAVDLPSPVDEDPSDARARKRRKKEKEKRREKKKKAKARRREKKAKKEKAGKKRRRSRRRGSSGLSDDSSDDDSVSDESAER